MLIVKQSTYHAREYMRGCCCSVLEANESMIDESKQTNVVFVHSSFRTGSTFVRSCFRRDPRALSFQEVFNENLADMTPEMIGHFNPGGWHSKHPSMAPYFLEFQSLLWDTGNGVKLYDRSMSYGTFFSGSELRTEEAAYIGQLIELAHKHDRVPVITCTRSLGRLQALKNEFGGLHLMIYRNIFDQWCSYTDQWLKGDSGFIQTIWLALNGSHGDELANKIGRVYATESRSPTDPKNFLAFCLLHLYLYARAADHASDIVDIDKLAADDDVRNRIEKLIKDSSGLAVDFSSAKQTKSFSLVDIGGTEILRDTLSAFPEIFAIPQTESGKKLVEEAQETLIMSYENFWRFSGKLANEFSKSLSELETAKGRIAESNALVPSLRAHIEMQDETIRSLRAHIAMLDEKNIALKEQHFSSNASKPRRNFLSFLKPR